MKNIIIIGSKGYKAEYGGWETFVTNLIDNYHNNDTIFYIPEITDQKNKSEYKIKNVWAKPIYTKKLGSITMMLFVFKAVLYYQKKIKKEKLDNVIMYILGCRVGPLFSLIHKKLNKMGVTIMINPDGLEWKRAKWNSLIKMYFKLSERTMIKSSNYVICDSKAILEYVNNKYRKYNVNTNFIAYGAYLKKSSSDKKVEEFYQKNNIQKDNYYLFVGRFVPENNIEIIIKEFMKTSIKKDLVIVSNVVHNNFYKKLLLETNFLSDSRIKFVGSVYDDTILRYIREYATAYIHGHSAGGTNPSLLEAFSITKINILYDVVYNREVGLDAALYFNQKEDSLKEILEKVEQFDLDTKNKYGEMAKKRIEDDYTWELVAFRYQNLFDKIIRSKV